MENSTDRKMPKSDKIFLGITLLVLISFLALLIWSVFTDSGRDFVKSADGYTIEEVLAMADSYESYVNEYNSTGSIEAKTKANEIAFEYTEALKQVQYQLDDYELPEDFQYYLETIK